ncbi:galactokinase [marine bacterium AO1-C]|nr:galactokinase [marine bacterium AO1-C]
MKKQELIDKVTTVFQERFNQTPALFFSPGRINLIGGHTDYNEGFVLPAAIDKGIVVGIQKNDKDHCLAYALDMDEQADFRIDEIAPIENGHWKNYVLGVVAETAQKHSIETNFNLVFAGNIPLEAGLSSSAALENSIAFGLNELFGLGMTREEMIFVSQKAEHKYAKVNCGIMDQYASMFGEKNAAILLDCRSLESTVFNIDFKGYTLLLVNSHVKHQLAETAYNQRREVCEKIAKMFGVKALRDISEADLSKVKDKLSTEDYQKALYVIQENERVVEASKAISTNDIQALGELLYASHEGLQHQYKVSCEELDFLVNATKENEAIAGTRMMGGGFGGCTINIIKQTAVAAFKEEITPLYQEKFNKTPSFYDVQISNGVSKIATTINS